MKIKIYKAYAEVSDVELLTSGMVGKTIETEYSSDWNGLTKVAVFFNGKISKDVVNPSDTIEIPWEILEEHSRTVSVGFYGYTIENGEKVLAIPTIYVDLGITRKGANPSGESSSPPAPSTIEQIQSEIENCNQQLQTIEACCVEMNANISYISKTIDTDEKKLKNLELAAKDVLYDDEVDTAEAYTKAVPSGALPYASLNMIGGKSVVFNQLGTIFELSWDVGANATKYFVNNISIIAGHKYFFFANQGSALSSVLRNTFVFNDGVAKYESTASNYHLNSGKHEWIVTATGSTGNGKAGFWCAGPDVNVTYSGFALIDLTKMFGAGNEPTELTDQKIVMIEAYLADHIEYNEGEIISAAVDEVVSHNSDNELVSTLSIPAAICDLDGYIEGFGDSYNYIDFEAKKFVKVGEWVEGEWKELDEPIETDISEYLDGETYIEVEGYGTVTFKNTSGNDYCIPVPNIETFIINIQEAIST